MSEHTPDISASRNKDHGISGQTGSGATGGSFHAETKSEGPNLGVAQAGKILEEAREQYVDASSREFCQELGHDFPDAVEIEFGEIEFAGGAPDIVEVRDRNGHPLDDALDAAVDRIGSYDNEIRLAWENNTLDISAYAAEPRPKTSGEALAEQAKAWPIHEDQESEFALDTAMSDIELDVVQFKVHEKRSALKHVSADLERVMVARAVAKRYPGVRFVTFQTAHDDSFYITGVKTLDADGKEASSSSERSVWIENGVQDILSEHMSGTTARILNMDFNEHRDERAVLDIDALNTRFR